MVASFGHTLVLRPTHSPDFGGVEWVFHFVSNFLQKHHLQVNNDTLKTALNACFNLVTKDDIKGYMAAAHFFVRGYKFNPYIGQQGSGVMI